MKQVAIRSMQNFNNKIKVTITIIGTILQQNQNKMWHYTTHVILAMCISWNVGCVS